MNQLKCVPADQTPTVPTLAECWAIVEIFGHQQYAGWVSTVALGAHIMIHIAVPELPERQELITLENSYPLMALHPETGERVRTPPGSVVKVAAVPGFPKIFGPAAIFGITPCSREACLKATEQFTLSRPWILVSLSTAAAIEAAGPQLVLPVCGNCGDLIDVPHPDHPGVCSDCESVRRASGGDGVAVFFESD
jgi:hypothetical protein